MQRSNCCSVPCLGVAGIVISCSFIMSSLLIAGYLSWKLFDSDELQDDTQIMLQKWQISDCIAGATASILAIISFIKGFQSCLIFWLLWNTVSTSLNLYVLHQYYAHSCHGLELNDQCISALVAIDWTVILTAATVVFKVVFGITFLSIATMFIYKVKKGEYEGYDFKDDYDDELFMEMT